MARLDALTTFIPGTAPLSCVGATGATFFSGVIDLLGQGVGTAPAGIIGNAATFGTDYGIGGGFAEPELICNVATAFATANSATLNVQIQAAPDQGSAGGYQPGSYTTLEETGPIAVANLTAGQKLARFDFPAAFPEGLQPRYIRLAFVTPAATNFTAGTIGYSGWTFERDDTANKFAAKNYVVA